MRVCVVFGSGFRGGFRGVPPSAVPPVRLFQALSNTSVWFVCAMLVVQQVSALHPSLGTMCKDKSPALQRFSIHGRDSKDTLGVPQSCINSGSKATFESLNLVTKRPLWGLTPLGSLVSHCLVCLRIFRVSEVSATLKTRFPKTAAEYLW